MLESIDFTGIFCTITLMDPKAILSLYDAEMRIAPADWQYEIYRRPGLTYLAASGPSPYAGWVLYTRLDDAEIDSAIQTILEFYEPRGGEFEWKVYDHDLPIDLKERLKTRGFIAEEIESLLAFDMESAPEQFWKPADPRLRRITDPKELYVIAQVQEAVWGEPFDDLVKVLGAEMETTPDGISVYLAEMDGQTVSCAWIRYYKDRQFAELYGGSTLESYRGQGLYSALVNARAQEARARGVRYLAVDTSPMSRPILEKLGFVFLTHSQPFVHHPERHA